MKRDNTYHVMRSAESGEVVVRPWLTKPLAEKLAAVLQEIEDDRRARAIDPTLRTMPEAFDRYYVKKGE